MVEQLKQDMISAMKNKEKDKLAVIRMVKAALDKEHIDNKKEINDDLLLDVVNKEIKMRRDSIEEFKKGNRDDLVTKTEQEIEYLLVYLPKQLTLPEINSALDEIFKKVESENPDTKINMGQIMKEVNIQLKGKVDMKTVSNLVKERLK